MCTFRTKIYENENIEAFENYETDEVEIYFKPNCDKQIVEIWNRLNKNPKRLTHEELKAEADRQGYNLIKKPKYVPLSRCVCGAKRSVKCWYVFDKQFLRCDKCGLTGESATTRKQARENWNKAVESRR